MLTFWMHSEKHNFFSNVSFWRCFWRLENKTTWPAPVFLSISPPPKKNLVHGTDENFVHFMCDMFCFLPCKTCFSRRITPFLGVNRNGSCFHTPTHKRQFSWNVFLHTFSLYKSPTMVDVVLSACWVLEYLVSRCTTFYTWWWRVSPAGSCHGERVVSKWANQHENWGFQEQGWDYLHTNTHTHIYTHTSVTHTHT